MPTSSLPEHLDAATRRRLERDFADLRSEYAPLLGADVVEQCLQATLDRMTSARGQSPFVPLLAQRFAREQLGALAQGEGLVDKTVPEVLFVCVHDAGRSQIAAAMLSQRARGTVHVRTAGTSPTSDINPRVAEVLDQRGLFHSGAYAKPLTDTVVRAADVVVTLGCADAVTPIAGQERFDWDIPDPEGKQPADIAAICDDLELRVAELLEHLRPLRP